MAAKGSSGYRAAAIIAWFGVFLFGGVLSAQPGIEAYDRGDYQAVREYLSAAPGETAEGLRQRHGAYFDLLVLVPGAGGRGASFGVASTCNSMLP